MSSEPLAKQQPPVSPTQEQPQSQPSSTLRVIDFLQLENVHYGVCASSKKSILEYVAGMISGQVHELTVMQIFEGLLSRERLGGTGLCNGIAIPHCRISNIDRVYTTFITLQRPVDFDARDGQPVDLLFALIVPDDYTKEHLQILALLAELFSNAELVDSLRACDCAESVYALLTRHG